MKKKQGKEHCLEELQFLVKKYTSGELPDSQMAAWLMAVNFQGMTSRETALLTQVMRDSGIVLDFKSKGYFCVDKHSTGGVGDKTTMILAPIAAACGVFIPMMAGRGLGHSGGTLDKLEAIPNFNVSLSLKEMEEEVIKNNFIIVGQTSEICPADKKIYALRDVTSTVESTPLICASIMSKKLAEGLQALVLDVKFGSGAFMKTYSDAKSLAKSLKSIGESNGLKVHAIITDMNQPLGKFIGNSLEIKECLDILRNESNIENGFDFYEETRELSLQLAAHMVWMAGKADSFEAAYKLSEKALTSGKAYDMFKDLCARQGPAYLDQLPKAQNKFEIFSEKSGFVKAIDTTELGFAAIQMGVGRTKSTDILELTAGIELHIKIGHEVTLGDKLYTLHGNDIKIFEAVKERLLNLTSFSKTKPEAKPLIVEKFI